jgi:hypothetical protein
MNRRLLLAAGCLAVLALTSGCLGIGTGPVSEDALDSDPAEPYAWETDRAAHITVQENTQFRAVMDVNRSTVDLFRRDGFGGSSPLSVEAVRYRYPNGTIITGSEFRERGGAVRETKDETVVELPPGTDRKGTLAFTSSGTPKRFTLPTYVDGTYEVVLPENRDIDFPVFGQVSPGNYETIRDDRGRVKIVWAEPVTADTVSVRYYLQRDLYIFAGVLGAIVLVGIGGLLYRRRQIERLRKQRLEMGVDVDTNDDDEPPGLG